MMGPCIAFSRAGTELVPEPRGQIRSLFKGMERVGIFLSGK